MDAGRDKRIAACSQTARRLGTRPWLLFAVLLILGLNCSSKRGQVKETKVTEVSDESSLTESKNRELEPSVATEVNGPSVELTEAQTGERQKALEAMDRGDYGAARDILFELNRQLPGNLSLENLLDSAAAALDEEQNEAATLLGNTQWKVIPSPYLDESKQNKSLKIKQGRVPSLKKISQKKNEIIDANDWLVEHEISLPTLPGGTAHIPKNLSGRMLLKAIDLGEHHVAIYGESYSGANLVAVLKNTGGVVAALNFEKWTKGPKDKPAESRYVERSVHWAEISGGTLFVSVSHMTYADSSGGLNAYIHAIDLGTGEHLWKSDPLVSNSVNFILKDGWIVTGYGFTREPDFLFVLDPKDGTTKKTVKLKSGPDMIIEKDGTLFVRTYNTDYQFEW